ncbi:Rv3654c family TadE-like protein [Bifidobacterium choloepi]|uniref:Pilus assembly protein TadE n=1 Tax=Bifidobacterium choloepi TaxID=2614131 RepID=A0A6I5MZY8_9BIFI|nr:Rv3654c family TadE-like protein [Bifidobacterium choloepi]NEG69837.1 pilus assembly protein TadE [Bifidobacterium choloepi]
MGDRHDDEGTITVVGVALVAAVGLLLTVLAAGADILLCQHRARTAADLAAIAGATAVLGGASSSAGCLAAQRTTQANGAEQTECVVEDGDVQVGVQVATGIPLLANANAMSRAGPVPCQ